MSSTERDYRFLLVPGTDSAEAGDQRVIDFDSIMQTMILVRDTLVCEHDDEPTPDEDPSSWQDAWTGVLVWVLRQADAAGVPLDELVMHAEASYREEEDDLQEEETTM